MHRDILQDHDDVRKIKGVLGEIYVAAANVYLSQNEEPASRLAPL